jgi:hypothetical protein
MIENTVEAATKKYEEYCVVYEPIVKWQVYIVGVNEGEDPIQILRDSDYGDNPDEDVEFQGDFIDEEDAGLKPEIAGRFSTYEDAVSSDEALV